MPIPVYFARLRARNEQKSKVVKIRKIFDVADFGDIIVPGDLTAIKIRL